MTKKTAKTVKKSATKKALPGLKETIAELRAALSAHGGSLELVASGRDWVEIRLAGACQHCPMAAETFKNAVEKMLLSRVKGLKTVRLAE